MLEAEVYVEGMKYYFISLVVGRYLAIVMGGVLCLRIPSGSELKKLKSEF